MDNHGKKTVPVVPVVLVVAAAIAALLLCCTGSLYSGAKLLSKKGKLDLVAYTDYYNMLSPKAADIEDELMYVADGRELHIIDLRSPQAFPLLASYDIEALAPGSRAIKDIIARGNYVYLITYNRGLVVLDVSDVSNPQVTDIYGISKHRTLLDLKVYRDHLYVIFPDEGVLIFDLVDPASPNYIARMQVATGQAREIDFSEDYAYIVLYQNGLSSQGSSDNFLEIWDIHNPYTPKRVLEYGDEERRPRRVVIQGDYAYLDRGHTRIGVLDISDPLAPKALGSVRTKGVIEEYIVDGDYVYIANNWNLAVVDVSNPREPKLVAWYEFGHNETVDKLGEFIYFTGSGLEEEQDNGVYKFRFDP